MIAPSNRHALDPEHREELPSILLLSGLLQLITMGIRFLGLGENLRLGELARFLINLPGALFLSVFETTFVPKLAIGVITLP